MDQSVKPERKQRFTLWLPVTMIQQLRRIKGRQMSKGANAETMTDLVTRILREGLKGEK